MNNKCLSALLTLMVTLPAVGKVITPEQALQRVKADSPALMAKGTGKGTPQLVYTALTEKGTPGVYIFNNPEGKGFVALSADDAALPLLGYSDRWNFTSDNLPPQLEWWLSEYSRQIEYARQKGMTSSPAFTRKISRSGAREPIAPQMKTMWDQIAPYNNQCPLSGNDRTWTGCVATAMAQVMKYWDYPEKGTGSITYTVESLEKKVTMNFGLKKFDWENMLDTYIDGQYTQEQADAVAYLMKACGYSVKMEYSMDSSGALAMNIGNAFKKYFNYDGNLLYTLREYYSSAEWDEMMYDNLKNVGPVVYGGGSALGGGHSFVCDGYDGEGLYHFNWGWSGMSDGYFSLDALNPDALGTGGGSGGGYNFTQDAVFGIQPPTGKPVEERPLFLTQEGELSGSLSGTTLSFSLTNSGEPMWVNYNPSTMYLKFGAMFYPQGDNAAEPIYHDISTKRFSIQPGYGTNSQVLRPSVNLSSIKLDDGTYKVVVGTVDVPQGTTSSATDGEGFVEVKPRYGMANYVTLKVENGVYSVSSDLLEPLKLSGEIIGDLYYGMLTKVRVTVENPSDVERTSGFAPVFCDSQGPVLLGESIYVSIPPKSKVTREWTTSLNQYVTFIDPFLDKPLTFTFFNEVDYSFYNDLFSAEVILKSNPGTPVIYLDSPLTIENSTKEGSNTIIPDCRNIHVTGSLSITRGLFNYPVTLLLAVPYNSEQVEIVNSVSQDIYMSPDSPETKTAKYDLTMSYPTADPEQQYYLVLAYQGPSGLVTLTGMTPVKFADISGIGMVEADNNFSVVFDRNAGEICVSASENIAGLDIFDITGRKADRKIIIDGARATAAVSGSGIFLVTVRDASGNRKTFKVN